MEKSIGPPSPPAFSPKTAAAIPNFSFCRNYCTPGSASAFRKWASKFDAAGKPAVVLDAPLLIEAGWKPFCDLVVMVDAPREIRLERAQQRGWTEADFNNREAAQVSLDEKRRLSDVIIANAGTEADLRSAVHLFWSKHIVP